MSWNTKVNTVTQIATVTTEEHVIKMPIINASATVSLALPAHTVKQVCSPVALLMYTLVYVQAMQLLVARRVHAAR